VRAGQAVALALGLLAGAAGCNPGVAMAVLVPGLASPCDYDGTLLIQLSGVRNANWGGTTKWVDRETNHGIRGRVAGGTVQVGFSDDSEATDMKLAGQAIEVFRGRERIDVPSKAEARGLTDGSCGHGFVTSYDLRALEPGRYTLVHRRACGINGEVYCGKEPCPWGTFEGEVDVVSDRAFGQIEMRGKPDTNEALAKCIEYALGYGEIESRPREPLIGRYEVSMGKESDSDLVLIQVRFVEIEPQPEPR